MAGAAAGAADAAKAEAAAAAAAAGNPTGSDDSEPRTRVRSKAPDPTAARVGLPARISPKLHKAFLQWVGLGGKIDAMMPREEWAKLVAKRKKLPEWRRSLAVHGMTIPEEATKDVVVMDALTTFLARFPEWSARE